MATQGIVAPLRLSGVQVTATPTGSDALNLTQSTVALAGKEPEELL